MKLTWTGHRRVFEVPCTVEIEQSSETLHAHVMLDCDIRIEPGDEVTVHNPPTRVEFGQRLVVRSTATVVLGNWFDRLLARIKGYLELTELYDVSFSDGRAT